jgi:hypothetical protein
LASLSANRRFLAYHSLDAQVFIVDLVGGRVITTLDVSQIAPPIGTSALALSVDGRLLARSDESAFYF